MGFVWIISIDNRVLCALAIFTKFGRKYFKQNELIFSNPIILTLATWIWKYPKKTHTSIA